MRKVVVVALLMPLAGCGIELLGATAIQSGMQADNAKRLTRQLDHAKDSTSRITAEHSIGAYYAEKGAYPPSLDTLVREGYLTEIPRKPDGTPYGYDPGTGALLDGPVAPAQPRQPQSSLSTPTDDSRTMQAIRVAILDYWKETRAYPPSLMALTPKYLASVPRTASGHDFVYDPGTGTLYHPRRGLPATSPATGAGNAGRRAGGAAATARHGGRRRRPDGGSHDGDRHSAGTRQYEQCRVERGGFSYAGGCAFDGPAAEPAPEPGDGRAGVVTRGAGFSA